MITRVLVLLLFYGAWCDLQQENILSLRHIYMLGLFYLINSITCVYKNKETCSKDLEEHGVDIFHIFDINLIWITWIEKWKCYFF